MEKSDVAVSRGFAPVLGDGLQVLILGSLPSRKSLQVQQYFANPQNAFWRIMAKIAGFDPGLSYEVRCRALTDQGVGLWDVLASSVRAGSLDSAIDVATAKANDFAALLAQHKDIKLICFNGQKSRNLFDRMVVNTTPVVRNCELLTLPSTSPAHAAMKFDEKLRRWSVIGSYLESSQHGTQYNQTGEFR